MPLPTTALQLNDYTFFQLRFRPNEVTFENGTFAPRALTVDDLDCEIRVLNEPAEDKEIVISLEVSVAEESFANNVPCDFAVNIMGRFSIPESALNMFDLDSQVRNGIVSNCATILYGTMRDFVHTISSKMPFGSVILPTTNFSRIEPIDGHQEEAAPNNQAELEAQPKKKSRSSKSKIK